jgi:hypothetical protein
MIINNRAQLLNYLNPEQRLLLLLCGNKNSENVDEAKVWLAKPFNWTKLIALSERHKLLPQLYKRIKEISLFIPIEIPSELIDKYHSQTEYVIRLASEGIRISCLLNQRGISNILLKGPFLSDQIYGDIAIRPSRDIDILVLPEFVEKVQEVLFEEGYRMVYPDFTLSEKQKSFYKKHKNQFAFRKPDKGILIEVHWRLFSQSSLLPIPTDKVFSESQERIIAGKSVRVLSPNQNFEFLCLHGSIHQWFRLLWLRDITQLLGQGKVNIDEVLLQAKKHNNEKPILQAIILTNHFFGTSYPINQKTEDEVKSIVTHAAIAIISDEKFTLSHKFTRFRMPIYKMKLKPGFFYKISCWSILQPNFNDWKMVKLPDYLFFLYFPLRPFIWFYTFYIRKNSKR